MSAPVIAINFVVTLTFAVLGKVAPSINAFTESYSARILAGLDRPGADFRTGGTVHARLPPERSRPDAPTRAPLNAVESPNARSPGLPGRGGLLHSAEHFERAHGGRPREQNRAAHGETPARGAGTWAVRAQSRPRGSPPGCSFPHVLVSTVLPGQAQARSRRSRTVIFSHGQYQIELRVDCGG